MKASWENGKQNDKVIDEDGSIYWSVFQIILVYNLKLNYVCIFIPFSHVLDDTWKYAEIFSSLK